MTRTMAFEINETEAEPQPLMIEMRRQNHARAASFLQVHVSVPRDPIVRPQKSRRALAHPMIVASSGSLATVEPTSSPLACHSASGTPHSVIAPVEV